MKSLIFSLILVFLSSFAMAFESEPVVTAEDSQIITEYLNNICGDTWCEGDYELSFYNVVSVQQADQTKSYINFVANSGYGTDAVQRPVSCEVQAPGLIEAAVSDLRANKFTTDAVDLLNYQVDACIQGEL